MNKKIYAIYGASGFGREVLPLARNSLSDQNDIELMFIDDTEANKKCNGVDIINFDQFLAIESSEKSVCLAIADWKVRQFLFQKLEHNSISHWSIFSNNSIILDNCEIGKNSVLAPFVTLTSNIKIGKSFQANLYSYVGHDCNIGDFVTFAPSVKCNGNVKIENNVYIGTGVNIKQGKPNKPLVIGEGAIIGMGAIITKSVPPGAKIFAIPSKPLKRKGIGG